MHILLLTPPMTQVNTPYPATAYLTGFLLKHGFNVSQDDPGLLLVLKLLSREGLLAIIQHLEKDPSQQKTKSVRSFLKQKKAYTETIDAVVKYLQGHDTTLAHRISQEGFLPRGPRFQNFEEMESGDGEGILWAFGALGLKDRAQHVASLYVDDLMDMIRDGIDPKFEFSRYGEKLAASTPSFDPILENLNAAPTLVDSFLDAITDSLMEKHDPAVVGMTLPFPGNVYGGFRMAKRIREKNPNTKIIFGGGYVNTELRELKDARVFDYVDYITLDDGEGPLLQLLNGWKNGAPPTEFLRTLVREEGKVVLRNSTIAKEITFKDAGTPTYQGLPLKQYLSLCEMLNPMHRLWTDGRWNKLTLAHGCYWKKCTFCDISLDYIGRYEAETATALADKMDAIAQETGETGFHFVDEAAPPSLLRSLSEELILRGRTYTWWANIRFEKAFTIELAELMSRAGCVAVSGGLEVASDRLLALMQKGVTVEQVASVTDAFTRSRIMVHAYLMYGFPTQTVQETVDALERVRQLFLNGCIQSAFWHRFSVTVHSPVGKNPEKYGIQLLKKESKFAQNDVEFTDSTGIDHGVFSAGLKKAVYNYMLGLGLEEDVRNWFEFPVPKSKVSKHLIVNAIEKKSYADKN